MKKILICLLLALPLTASYAQDIHFGLRLQGQLGKGGILSYVPLGNAYGMALEANLNIALREHLQFETGLGIASRQFGMRIIYDQDDGAPDADYAQASQVLTLPVRFRLRSELSPKTDLFLNVGYQLGGVISDQLDYDWDTPRFPGQEESEQHSGNFEHGLELGLEVEFPLSERHQMGLGVNYQNIRRAAGYEAYYAGRFHLAGFSVRFARRVRHSSTN